MSYRLINSNEIAIKYPEVNEMPCIFADLPNGLNGKHYEVEERKQGKWIYMDTCYECSVCHNAAGLTTDFCPHCGAEMRGNENG